MTQPQIAVRPLRPSRPGAEISGIDANNADPAGIENLKYAQAKQGSGDLGQPWAAASGRALRRASLSPAVSPAQRDRGTALKVSA